MKNQQQIDKIDGKTYSVNVDVIHRSKLKKYIDPEHKLIAEASSKKTAWMLIRNECHRLGLNVPTIDKIFEYK